MSSLPRLHPLTNPLIRTVVGEIQGTFILAAVIVLVTSFQENLHQVAQGISLSLVPLVYCLGYVSGAFYNPAVVTSVFLVLWNRKFKRARLLVYEWFVINTAIVVAATVGGWAGAYLVGNQDILKSKMANIKPSDESSHGVGRAFVGEFIFTFNLISVILHTGFSKKYAGAPNSFYGLAIGLAVFAGITCIGPISGAALNPAMPIAMGFVRYSVLGDSDSAKWVWLYQIACHAAGVAAAVLFILTSNEEVSVPREEKERLAQQGGKPIGCPSNKCNPNANEGGSCGTAVQMDLDETEDVEYAAPYGKEDQTPLVIPCTGGRMVQLKCQ